MKEIKVKISGGLGNQLFQYSYARMLQKNFLDSKIILDISYYNKRHIRNIDIDKYVLGKNVFFEKKKDYILNLLYCLYRFKSKILKKIGKKCKNANYNFGNRVYIFCDKSFDNKIELNGKKKIFLAGYFQQEKEISGVIKEVRKELKLRKKSRQNNYIDILDNEATIENSIGVSIRIGEDYKRFGWPVCNREYYLSGLNYLIRSVDNPVIYIFSDNIELVKNEKWFENYNNIVYVEKCSSVEGLEILRKCQNFVIANSTYSWWGAYLCDYPKKKIVAPKYFYKNEIMKKSAINIQGVKYLDNFTGK